MIVVTGGAGFVGSNLVRLLAHEGERIRVIDDLSAGRREYLDGLDVELLVGDIADSDTARRAVAGATSLVHLAASTAVLESIADPLPGLQLNVVALVGLLRAAVAAGVSRLVFASSNAAVGQSEPPIDERRVAKPSSPYGASKLAGEGYCWAFAQSYGLPTVILRFANVYGPNSLHKGSAVHKFIRAAIAGERIAVYGDGNQTRDFIYVADVCEAIRLALTMPATGELFQIGTGTETTVLALLRTLEKVSGHSLDIEHLAANPGEIRRSMCDIRKAAALLMFRPTVPLEEGMRLTFGWFQEQTSTRAADAVVTRPGE